MKNQFEVANPNRRLVKEKIGYGLVVAGLALVSIAGFANFGDSSSSDPVEPVTSTDVNPYTESEVLVYAPQPLTAEQAIDYFVARDQLRLPEDAQAELADQLTADFESQTGLQSDEVFPGNASGTHFIRIAE